MEVVTNDDISRDSVEPSPAVGRVVRWVGPRGGRCHVQLDCLGVDPHQQAWLADVLHRIAA
ncbi:hypothetical protein QO004_004776 [Rhizobium mesoamericanum]|nr:hypothetical protein [Rhizobium mesoamericanum]